MKPKDFIWPFMSGENGLTQGKRRWDLSTLVAAAEKCEEFDYDLMSLDLERYPWAFDGWSFMSFLFHFNRCMEVDTEYPILLTPEGYVADGWHRIARAIIDGKTSIRAKRFKVMPEPDSVED